MHVFYVYVHLSESHIYTQLRNDLRSNVVHFLCSIYKWGPGDQMEKIEKEKKNMSGFSLSLIW